MGLRDGQQVRVLTSMYDSLSSILEMHVIEGQNQLVQVVL